MYEVSPVSCRWDEMANIGSGAKVTTESTLENAFAMHKTCRCEVNNSERSRRKVLFEGSGVFLG